MKRTVIIHGHFYQPPRMNPWTGAIESQESAYPADNWNERIYHECYLPNTRAEIKSPQGELDLVNNFEYISFNVGPTLSSWLAENYIKTYEKILSADWMRNTAVAMPYNHTILPLDINEIRKIQIKWGIKEFEMRYKRYPKGMWLPECAVNKQVIKDLIEEEIKFIVLTRGQAESISRLHGRKYYDISDNALDVRRPYRFFIEDGRHIDIFFSHHELSVDISFNNLLNNPVELANRIEKIFGHKHSEDMVVTIATDGETFGHHHKGSEKGLAYLLKYELPSRGIEVSNFEKYLKKYPPNWEVKIKENSSWSCYHGLERWKSSCGCGAEEGKDLEWRKPLRESITWLGQRAVEFIKEKKDTYFNDSGWEGVYDCGKALSNLYKSEKFQQDYVKPEFENSIEVKKFMELIYFTCYMFTSCGWFFGSFFRFEPVQNLSFSLKVIELLREVWNMDLEEGFVQKLNSHPDSVYVWNGLVKNRKVGPEKIADKLKSIYQQTGIRKGKNGYWYIDINEKDSKPAVKMEHIRTGEIYEF
ncbi:MAG: DUF3536 domain-containing protein [Elusimicrobiota bacterium]